MIIKNYKLIAFNSKSLRVFFRNGMSQLPWPSNSMQIKQNRLRSRSKLLTLVNLDFMWTINLRTRFQCKFLQMDQLTLLLLIKCFSTMEQTMPSSFLMARTQMSKLIPSRCKNSKAFWNGRSQKSFAHIWWEAVERQP